jgi:hypothetical protein
LKCTAGEESEDESTQAASSTASGEAAADELPAYVVVVSRSTRIVQWDDELFVDMRPSEADDAQEETIEAAKVHDYKDKRNWVRGPREERAHVLCFSRVACAVRCVLRLVLDRTRVLTRTGETGCVDIVRSMRMCCVSRAWRVLCTASCILCRSHACLYKREVFFCTVATQLMLTSTACMDVRRTHVCM